MTMIETYECPEIAAEPPEASEEARALLAKMNLSAQQGLTAPEADPQSPRMPFRLITAEEDFAYRVLCPVRCEAAKYSGSSIPLRVLKVLETAHDCGVFESFEVWDRRSALVKDPVLVAIRTDPAEKWRKQTYILARWGEELQPLSVMLKDAVVRQRAALRAVVDELRSKIELVSASIDSDHAILERGPETPHRYNL